MSHLCAFPQNVCYDCLVTSLIMWKDFQLFLFGFTLVAMICRQLGYLADQFIILSLSCALLWIDLFFSSVSRLFPRLTVLFLSFVITSTQKISMWHEEDSAFAQHHRESDCGRSHVPPDNAICMTMHLHTHLSPPSPPGTLQKLTWVRPGLVRRGLGTCSVEPNVLWGHEACMRLCWEVQKA